MFKSPIFYRPNAIHENIIYQVALSAHFLKNRDIFTVLKLALYGSENDSLNAAELMLLVEDIKMLNLSKGCEIKRAKYNPVILILDKVSSV